MKKKIAITIRLFLLLIICFVSVWMYAVFIPVISKEEGYVYYLRAGIGKKQLITDLSQQGIIQHPFLFALYIYPQSMIHLKKGEYLFHKGSTFSSIWKQVTNGTGFFYHAFTIVPGRTFNQLRNELLQEPALHHITAKWNDQQIMQWLGYPALAPEGEFFPETYYYTRDVPDLVILQRAFDLMKNKLAGVWVQRSPNLPYKNAYEVLIAASLIEKEAFLSAERPIIAGVLVNRLRKNMLLQFDPTVIYGLSNRYVGKIHKQDLLENTPYNTYIHRGLPPTPIAMPSLASLQAAVHPDKNDYFYFVAKGDGSHQFSKTLSEHHAAVKKAQHDTKLSQH